MRLALEHKNWDEVADIREQLHQLLKEDAMGFVVRSRFGQNAEEERASLFHAGRELKNNKNNLFTIKRQGVQITDESEIEAEVTSFFNALFNGHHDSNLRDTGVSFTPDNTHLDQLLTDLSRMNKDESEKLEVDVCADELEFVISKCANNKSPGLDGLSYEFYKHTWPVIKDTFLSVLQCQLHRNRLILSDTCGATRLIPKVDGVPKVDELRPITLLNCDYKICAKLLVLRMKPIMPKVIRSSQLCSVGSKNILFGVFNLISNILAINQRKIGACLLSLDFFKAYDRVYLKFLFVVMKRMGFGDKFITWIEMLHVGAKTQFLLAKMTDPIFLSFSIRQGDPLAMLLYIIYMEPLLVYLEKRISGLKQLHTLQILHPLQGGTEAYCDDVNVITASIDDLLIVDEAVKKFEAVSGAILSRNRSVKF